MAIPKVSEQWSQLGASLILTMIENDAVDTTLPEARQRAEEITNSLRALFHLAFRFGLEPRELMVEAINRYTQDLETEA